jgi:hypothetical protein
MSSEEPAAPVDETKVNSYRPGLGRIIWTDLTAFNCVVYPAAVWIIFIAWAPDWTGDGPFLAPALQPYVLGALALGTLLAAGWLAWRVYRIWRLFRTGLEVRGRITVATMRGYRGQVDYTYTYGRYKFKQSANLHRNKRTLALRDWTPVTLLIDRQKPQLSVIRDLYL